MRQGSCSSSFFLFLSTLCFLDSQPTFCSSSTIPVTILSFQWPSPRSNINSRQHSTERFLQISISVWFDRPNCENSLHATFSPILPNLTYTTECAVFFQFLISHFDPFTGSVLFPAGLLKSCSRLTSNINPRISLISLICGWVPSLSSPTLYSGWAWYTSDT